MRIPGKAIWAVVLAVSLAASTSAGGPFTSSGTSSDASSRTLQQTPATPPASPPATQSTTPPATPPARPPATPPATLPATPPTTPPASPPARPPATLPATPAPESPAQPLCPGGEVSGICGCPFATDNLGGNLTLVAGPVESPNSCCNGCLSIGPQTCNHWVFCVNPKGQGCGDPGECAKFVSDPANASIITNSPVPNDPSDFCAPDGSWPKNVCFFKNGNTKPLSKGRNGGWTSGKVF